MGLASSPSASSIFHPSLLPQPRSCFSHQRSLTTVPSLQSVSTVKLTFTSRRPMFHRQPAVTPAMASAAVELDVQSCGSQDQSDMRFTTPNDLLIVGPGVLGKLIAESWLKEHAGCKVVGQTNTTAHHEELRLLGVIPVIKSSGRTEDRFPYVIFCAPPSGSEDYAAEVRAATRKWNGEGIFLFTSSSAVYDCSDNGPCDEDTPVVPLGKSARTDVILRAEEEVLKAGGTIIRFAGLYTFDRGPHAYWAMKRIVDARPDHILNLIHYEDAASLCITILKKGLRGRVFMGCDNNPLSRGELMDIVNKSSKFEKFERFIGVDGPLGKRMDNSKTRSETGWQPKYKSFIEFIGVS